ncbi:hypothetical protein FPOAC2_11458 [Fusarium poae]|jgi:hypothetical protein
MYSTVECRATCQSNDSAYSIHLFINADDDVASNHDLHRFDVLISNPLLELEFDRFKRSPAPSTDIPGCLQRSVNSGLGALVPEPKIDICRPRHIRLIQVRAIEQLPVYLWI